MSNQPLFRSEALNAKRSKWLGEILLIRPFGFKALTLAAALIALLIVLFLIFGSYTKRSTVAGELVPDTGVAKIYTPQRGTIVKRLVKEGEAVKQGQVMFVVSSERHRAKIGSIEAEISRQVGNRREFLLDEQAQTIRQHQEERDALTIRIKGLQTELARLDSAIASQRQRLDLAEEAYKRYQTLFEQDYIARDEVERREQDLLDQRSRLLALERDRASLAGQRASAQADLSTLAFRQKAQLAQLDRTLAGLSQERTESEGNRGVEIIAPEDGIATAVTGTIGQIADASRPLVSIVPKDATLYAQLYAPSRAVGFIEPGDQVMLRFQAYPYQKFGHQAGRVVAVSKTALPASEIANFAGNQAPGGQQSEPLYRITVTLSKQTVTAYGKKLDLQAGMLLEADVLQDRRRLYEWVLEPLYSLTGKI